MDVKVKICGITNIPDAIAAVEAGADLLGFVMSEPSPRHVTIETAREIARALPPGTRRAAVFVNPKVEPVMFALRICDFWAVQFHGEETPQFCSQFGVKTIKAFRLKDESSLAPMGDYQTDFFLLDSYVDGKPGGTGSAFNWDLAVAAKRFGKPFFLAGGLTPDNVTEAVQKVQPYGVDVSTGVESSPGMKDHAKVRDFIAAVRAA